MQGEEIGGDKRKQECRGEGRGEKGGEEKGTGVYSSLNFALIVHTVAAVGRNTATVPRHFTKF